MPSEVFIVGFVAGFAVCALFGTAIIFGATLEDDEKAQVRAIKSKPNKKES